MRDDYLSLGAAPRPATGDEFVQRIRDRLLEEEPDSASLREALLVLDRTAIKLEGDDVASLAIDATGVVVGRESLIDDLRNDARRDEAGPRAHPQQPAIVARTPGVLRSAVVHAHPLEIAGVAIDLDVRLAGLPFYWIEAADGSVGIEAAEPDADRPLSGDGAASVSQAELVDAVRAIGEAVAAEQGFELRRLDVRLSPAGPRGVRIDAEAKVRKGILGASVEATGAATIDDAHVLRFGDVALSSGNVIVAGMLGLVRSRIAAATARPIPLVDRLPAGIRVTDLRLDVGPTIALSVRLG